MKFRNLVLQPWKISSASLRRSGPSIISIGSLAGREVYLRVEELRVPRENIILRRNSATVASQKKGEKKEKKCKLECKKGRCRVDSRIARDDPPRVSHSRRCRRIGSCWRDSSARISLCVRWLKCGKIGKDGWGVAESGLWRKGLVPWNAKEPKNESTVDPRTLWV